MHVAWLGKPHNVNKSFEALPGKLDIKRHSPSILYVAVCVLCLFLTMMWVALQCKIVAFPGHTDFQIL